MRSWVTCIFALAIVGCSAPNNSAAPAPIVVTPAPAAPGATLTLLGQAGIPQYPGATQSGSAVSPESGGSTHFYVILGTPDPLDKVVSFYKDQLKFPSSTKDGVTQIVGRTKQGADMLMFLKSDQGETQISIKGILYSKKQP